LLNLFFDHEDGREKLLRNGVIYNTELFITTAVRTSNPTQNVKKKTDASKTALYVCEKQEPPLNNIV
jgi:hypothetical protein